MSAFASPPPKPTAEVTLSDFMSEADQSSIKTVFGVDPKGKFMKGRKGYTHYMLDVPPTSSKVSAKGYVCCCHGIGTNVNVYSDLSKGLVSQGYTVLRYDFFNHGWSKSDNLYLKIDDNVMVEQVEDLLSHVLPDAGPVNFVGHRLVRVGRKWEERSEGEG